MNDTRDVASASEARPAAAVFCADFLPWSETFVHDEVTRHRRWDVEVFTARRRFSERFPFAPVHVGGPWFQLTGRSRPLAARLRARRFDLVHAHFGPMGARALPWAERFGLPLVVTFHGHDVPVLGSFERFRPRYLEYALRAPALLARMTLGVCASRELRELLIEVGAPAERLVVHPLGVDLRRFARRAGKRASADPLVVMMVGRFVAKKGFAYGLRAFAAARRKAGKDARLVVCGEGELGDSLRALAAQLGVADRVEWTGVLTPVQLAARLERADVLLAPSVTPASGDRESGLMVVKEACAAGVVPIGTWHGGIPEIITDGETGFLVGERDVDALADRLTRLLVDGKLRTRLATAARARVEAELDLDARVARLEELYDEVIRRGATRAAARPSAPRREAADPPAA